MDAGKRRKLPASGELAVWRAHHEAVEIARSRIESRMRRESGLSDGDYRVLIALSEAEGKSMRSSQLAAHLEWERSRVSGQLGRMEKRGLLRREPSPEDARGSLVVLTEEGARAYRGSTIPHLAAIKEIFIDAFTPEQLASLEDAAAALRTHLGMPAR